MTDERGSDERTSKDGAKDHESTKGARDAERAQTSESSESTHSSESSADEPFSQGGAHDGVEKSADSGGESVDEMTATPPKRPRWRRWIGRLAISMLLLLAAFALALPRLSVLATQHLLDGPLGRELVNRRPERFQMNWRTGTSSRPGTISFEGVVLRGQSARAAWQLEADELTFQVVLPSLLVAIFETEQVRGRGVRFYLERLGTEQKAGESPRAPDGTLPGRPPIERLTSPVVPDAAAAAPSTPNPEELERTGRERENVGRLRRWLVGGRPWTLDLNDIVLDDVHQVWIERQNVEGELDFRGTMRFALRRYVQFDSLVLGLAEATLRDGDTLLLDGASGTLDLDLAPLVPRRTELPALARSVSGRVRLDARLRDLGVLRRSFEPLSWLDVQVEGDLEADVGLERGLARSGSFVRIDASRAQLDLFDQEVLGTGHLEARFERAEGAVQAGELVSPSGAGSPEVGDSTVTAAVDVVLAEFTSRPRGGTGSSEPLLLGRELEARLLGIWPALDQLPRLEHGQVRLTDTEVRDLGGLQRYVPASSGVELRSGKAQLDLQLTFEGTRGRGRAALRGERVRLRVRDVVVRSDLELDARMNQLDLDRRLVSIDGTTMRLSSLLVEDPPAPRGAQLWWARTILERGSIDWRSGAPRFNARFAGSMRDSRPLVAYYLSSRRLLAPLVDLLTIENLDISGDLELEERSTRIQCFSALAPKVHIQADFDLGAGRPTGIALFESGRFRLGLEAGAAERDWKVLRPRRWFAQQRVGRCEG